MIFKKKKSNIIRNVDIHSQSFYVLGQSLKNQKNQDKLGFYLELRGSC